MYKNDGNLKMHVSYVKYTLFLKKSSNTKTSSASLKIKAINTNNLREILLKVEKIKVKLLEQYTNEYRLISEEL